MKWVLAFVMCLVAPMAAAEELVTIRFDEGASGAWLITLENGQITIEETKVIKPDDNPNPPPPPDPSDLTERGKKMRDLAAPLNDSENAGALAGLLYGLADQVKDQKITSPTKLATALRIGMAVTLGSSKKKWDPVATQLSSYWTELDQAGSSVAEYGKLLDEAGDGIMATVPKDSRLKIDWERIRMIIEMILQIIDIFTENANAPAPPG